MTKHEDANKNPPLILAKPPKKFSEMTRQEIEDWARQLFEGMKADKEASK